MYQWIVSIQSYITFLVLETIRFNIFSNKNLYLPFQNQIKFRDYFAQIPKCDSKKKKNVNSSPKTLAQQEQKYYRAIIIK